MARVGYYLLSKWGKDEVEKRVLELIPKLGLRHKDDLWFEIGIKRSTYYKVTQRKRPVERATIALILEALQLDATDKRFYDANAKHTQETGESSSVKQETSPAYFLSDRVAQTDIRVCFEALTAKDADALNEEDWQGARFGDVWKALAENEVAQKLTLCEGEGKPIFGIVWAGTVQRMNGKLSALRDSVLEAAPAHRHKAAGRRYYGIGRVLVARLVLESKAQGGEGRLLVRPVQDSISFYTKLGFQPAQAGFYVLDTEEAEALLKVCMSSSME